MKRESQRIIFVTGKGGVGKSAVAASLALLEAKRGAKVLLAELGEKSFYRHVFPSAGSATPTQVTAGLDVVRWEVDHCLREYLRHYLRLDTVVDLFFSNRIMRSFVGAAPGLRELVLLGKITSGVRGIGPDLPYDVVVVDAFATGHFRALCLACVGMAEVVRFGPMGEQSRQMEQVLRNRKTTSMVLVTLPEELPINETGELKDFLKTQFQQEPTVILNRCLPLPLSGAEIDRCLDQAKTMSASPRWLSEFCEYLKEQGRRQESATQKIRSWEVPTVETPWLFISEWSALIRSMSESLEARWPRG